MRAAVANGAKLRIATITGLAKFQTAKFQTARSQTARSQSQVTGVELVGGEVISGVAAKSSQFLSISIKLGA